MCVGMQVIAVPQPPYPAGGAGLNVSQLRSRLAQPLYAEAMLRRLPQEKCALPQQPGCLQPHWRLQPAAPHPLARYCVQGLQLRAALAAEAWTPPQAAVLHLTGADPCPGSRQAPAGKRAGDLSSPLPCRHQKDAHFSWQGSLQPIHQSQLNMTYAGALAAVPAATYSHGWRLPGGS